MIIVRLKGGLGNQMFQYACGKALLLRNQADGRKETLKLDATEYSRKSGSDTPRSFSLGIFKAETALATDEEIRRLKYPLGALSKAWRLFRAKALRRFDTGYDPDLLLRRGNAYLDGYWQSERYFTDIADAIRSDFSLKAPLGDAAEAAARAISAEHCPVSLHVRRGDYASDPKTNAAFGTCSPEYYRKAIAFIREKAPNARFFVFSDDIAWTKANLELPPNTVFVSDPNATRIHEELALMSMCRHHIIANSTFSWWGAWLDPRPGKIVVAPARWFNHSPRSYHKDIVPDSWIKI